MQLKEHVLEQTYIQLIKMVPRQIPANLMTKHSVVEHKPRNVSEN